MSQPENDASRSQSWVTERVSRILAEIEQHNPASNIYISVSDCALAEAAESDRRRQGGQCHSEIDGIVVSVKDNIDVQGLPTTAGMGVWRDRPAASQDAFAIARLREAGAVVIGKSSMHAAAFGATNRNPHFGDCINPAHAGTVPGGSSGGAGASVAMGWADLAIGTDTLGSARIPAAYCGVVGFKPTFGVVSTAGSVPLYSPIDHFGLLAQSVGLVQRALPILWHFDETHPYARDIARVQAVAPRTLRAPATLAGLDVDPGVWDAFQGALSTIESMGFTIDRFDADASVLGQIRRAGLVLCEAQMLVTYHEEWSCQPNALPDDLAAALRWISTKGAQEVAKAQLNFAQGHQVWRQWRGNADILLLPTTPHRPFPMDTQAPASQADLTALANIVGAPALSLPIPSDSGASSVGLQILAEPGRDMSVLAFAEAVEQVFAEV